MSLLGLSREDNDLVLTETSSDSESGSLELELEERDADLASESVYVKSNSVASIAVDVGLASYGPEMVDLLLRVAKDGELENDLSYLLTVFKDYHAAVKSAFVAAQNTSGFNDIFNAREKADRLRVWPRLRDATRVNLATKVESERQKSSHNALSLPSDLDKIGLVATANSHIKATTYHLPDAYLTDGSTKRVVLGHKIENNIIVLANLTAPRPIRENDNKLEVDSKFVRASASQYSIWCEYVKRAALVLNKKVSIVPYDTIRKVATNLLPKYIESGNRVNVTNFREITIDDKYADQWARIPMFTQIPLLVDLVKHLKNSPWNIGARAMSHVIAGGYTTKNLADDRDFRRIGRVENIQEPFEFFATKFRSSVTDKNLWLYEFAPLIEQIFAIGHSEENRWETWCRSWGAHLIYDLSDLDKSPPESTLKFPIIPPHIEPFDSPCKTEALAEEMEFESNQYSMCLTADLPLPQSVPEFVPTILDDKTTTDEINKLISTKKEWNDKVWIKAVQKFKARQEYYKDTSKFDAYNPETFGKFKFLISDICYKASEENPYTKQVENVQEEEKKIWKRFKKWVDDDGILIFKWVPTKHKGDAVDATFDWETYLLVYFMGYLVRADKNGKEHNGEIHLAVFPKSYQKKIGSKYNPNEMFEVTLKNVQDFSKTIQLNMAVINSIRNMLLMLGMLMTSNYTGRGLIGMRYSNPDLLKKYCSISQHMGPDEEKARERELQKHLTKLRIKHDVELTNLNGVNLSEDESKEIRREIEEEKQAKLRKEESKKKSAQRRRDKKESLLIQPQPTQIATETAKVLKKRTFVSKNS